MFRPFVAVRGRDFDLDVAESRPMLDLFSFSRLATVSERFLGTTGAGEGLPGGDGSVSLSARSGFRPKSSAVRGRFCRCERRLWCRERGRALDELCEVSDRRLARCSLKCDSRLVGSSSWSWSWSAMVSAADDAGQPHPSTARQSVSPSVLEQRVVLEEMETEPPPTTEPTAQSTASQPQDARRASLAGRCWLATIKPWARRTRSRSQNSVVATGQPTLDAAAAGLKLPGAHTSSDGRRDGPARPRGAAAAALLRCSPLAGPALIAARELPHCYQSPALLDALAP